MNIGQFVAAEIIILLVIASVEKLILGLESFYDVLTSIEKIGQIVDKEIENQDGEKPIFTNNIAIELKEVSYRIPGRDSHIIKNVSLKINSKSRILILGESGSGKSSFLKLIAGINEPTAGYIYVNNLSIASLNLNHYRAQLGLSLTEETPFEGSIKENLTFGNSSISNEEIFDVLAKIGLMDFIKEQSKGLQTILYPDGKQMSHTVSKKLILARAILKKPKVIILEDALDRFNATETNAIVNYLSHKDRPWALIVVSGNDNWIKKCTEVIHLEKGEIKNI